MRATPLFIFFVLKGINIRDCWETNQPNRFFGPGFDIVDNSDVSVMNELTLELALRNE